ncbi:MAG: hypothetical protein JWM40_2936 [Frankiales bacterium]|nr:hypothetical protein [Frankiales bacterium]
MKTIEQRFWPKVHKTSGCWTWTASTNGRGYGQMGRGGRGEGIVLAHRVSYELHHGPIPEGLQIDHLCRNRLCVRPDHLQAVDARTNLLRAPGTMTSRNAHKTHCIHGHELAGDNLIIERGRRSCRTCKNQRQRDRWNAGVRSPSAGRRRVRPCEATSPERCRCQPA